MPFNIHTEGNAFGALSRLAQHGRDALMRVTLKAAHGVQAKAKINVHQKLNTTGKAKGTLSRSVTVLSNRSKLEAEIGPSVVYGRIHELGGVIKPVKARMLAIPIGTYTGYASTHDDLHIAGSVERKNMVLADPTGKPQYVLKPSVNIPARPYLQPALNDVEPQIEGMVNAEILNLLGGPSGDVSLPKASN